MTCSNKKKQNNDLNSTVDPEQSESLPHEHLLNLFWSVDKQPFLQAFQLDQGNMEHAV